MQIKAAESMAVSVGKKKRTRVEVDSKAKRGGLFADIERHQAGLPEPWRYDLKPTWNNATKDDVSGLNVAKSMQSCKFKWTAVPKENQVFQEPQKAAKGKPDMNAKKYTFIDKIISSNTKEKYPLPSPCSYFMDEIAVKKLMPEQADLVLRKNENDKGAKGTFGWADQEGEARVVFV